MDFNFIRTLDLKSVLRKDGQIISIRSFFFARIEMMDLFGGRIWICRRLLFQYMNAIDFY